MLSVSLSENFSKCSLYVLTVGSNEPRHVAVTMPAVLSPSVEHKLLVELRSSIHYQPPVHHNGSLHWCTYFSKDIMGGGGTTGGGGDILVFDTEAESFRLMRGPAQTGMNRKLFNMKGKLAFWGSSALSSYDISVWVMQDYKAGIWVLKYRIDLLKVEASRQLYFTSSKKKTNTRLDSAMQCILDIAVLSEHEVLLMFNNRLVLRCDIDGKFLGMVKIGNGQYCMMLTHHLLQESIIPIPSHEMQGEDEEPAFSTGRA